MYQHALIVGKFAPPHRGHQLLIDTALQWSRHLTVLVYATPDFTSMPSQMRAGWLRAIYPDADFRVPENPPLDSADDETHRHFVRRYLSQMGITPDLVVSSESYGPGFAEVLGVSHHMVDAGCRRFPVRASAIRSDPSRYLDALHPVVRDAIGNLPDIGRRG